MNDKKFKQIEFIFLEAQKILNNFFSNNKNIELIISASEQMIKTLKEEGKIISCGNGGSMTDAMHFAEELTARFRENRPSLPAIAISDPGFISCVANDYGYENIFSRFIEGIGNKGDVLLAISTSGNSKNVINAAKIARKKEIKVIGLTGKDGGKLAELCDIEIRIPHFGYADRIQEMHIKIIHSFVEYIETEMFNQKKK